MKYLNLFIITLLILPAISFAQEDYKIDKDKAIEWTFEEKMKLSPEHLMKFAKKEGGKKELLEKKIDERAANHAVSDGPEVESEIHAAINPTDSSNIVISPINMNASAGEVNCPIYYTNDFGQT